MALLPAGHTFQFDASVLADLATTFVSGGPHTGTPADGGGVEVWRLHSGGSTPIWKKSGASAVPVVRIAAPLMPFQCLDFTGGQRLELTDATGTTSPWNTMFTASAWTFLIAFRMESITSTNGVFYNADSVVGETSGYWGVYASTVSSVPKIALYNWGAGANYGAHTIVVGQNHVLCGKLSGGNLITSLDNGSDATLSSGNTGAGGSVIRMGAGTYAGGNGDVRIGEVVAFNTALGGTDWTDAKTYMYDKWILGIGASSAKPAAMYAQQWRR